MKLFKEGNVVQKTTKEIKENLLLNMTDIITHIQDVA
jgi:hypothetical protein